MTDRGTGDLLWEAITGGDARAAAAAAARRSGRPWDRPARPGLRRALRRRVATAVVLLLLLGTVTSSSADGLACRAGIPAYFYPGADDRHWPAVAGMSPGTIVIVNPASGPGTSVDPRYVAALAQARRSAPALYGYVDTAYGTRSADVVRREAETWREWYGIEGIFLDQTSSGPGDVPYYSALTGWLHGRGFAVAMNPGQPDLDRRYLAMADHLITFEGPYAQYLRQRFPRPQRGSAGRVWHLVYDVPGEVEMRRTVALARRRQAGTVFVTDGSMPNPWDRLPAYWPQEQRLLARC